MAALGAIGAIGSLAGSFMGAQAQKKQAKAERIAAIMQYQSDLRAAEAQRAALAESAKADEKIALANEITQLSTENAAAAEIELGNAQWQGHEFKAKQFDRESHAERAAAQIEAFDVRKHKVHALSSLIAKAAASGGGGLSDKGIQVLASGIEKEGEFRALTKMYIGENAARGFEDAAAGERLTGDAVLKGARARAEGLTAQAAAGALQGQAELERLQAQRKLIEAGIADPNVAFSINLAKSKATKAAATGTLLSGIGSAFSSFSKLNFG